MSGSAMVRRARKPSRRPGETEDMGSSGGCYTYGRSAPERDVTVFVVVYSPSRERWEVRRFPPNKLAGYRVGEVIEASNSRVRAHGLARRHAMTERPSEVRVFNRGDGELSVLVSYETS